MVQVPEKSQQIVEAKGCLSDAGGCVLTMVLLVALALHIFADKIWDKEPAILKWFVIGYGLLVLIGLVAGLFSRMKDERVGSLVLLLVVVLVAVIVAVVRLF